MLLLMYFATNGPVKLVAWVLVLVFFLPYVVVSTELNCAAPQTSGKFTCPTDCTLATGGTDNGGGIQVSNTMSVTGRKNLTTITATSGQRHFYVTTQTLTLKWLTLTRGSGGNSGGGSIEVNGADVVDGELTTLTRADVDQHSLLAVTNARMSIVIDDV